MFFQQRNHDPSKFLAIRPKTERDMEKLSAVCEGGHLFLVEDPTLQIYRIAKTDRLIVIKARTLDSLETVLARIQGEFQVHVDIGALRTTAVAALAALQETRSPHSRAPRPPTTQPPLNCSNQGIGVARVTTTQASANLEAATGDARENTPCTRVKGSSAGENLSREACSVVPRQAASLAMRRSSDRAAPRRVVDSTRPAATLASPVARRVANQAVTLAARRSANRTAARRVAYKAAKLATRRSANRTAARRAAYKTAKLAARRSADRTTARRSAYQAAKLAAHRSANRTAARRVAYQAAKLAAHRSANRPAARRSAYKAAKLAARRSANRTAAPRVARKAAAIAAVIVAMLGSAVDVDPGFENDDDPIVEIVFVPDTTDEDPIILVDGIDELASQLDIAHHARELTTLVGCWDTQEVSFYDDDKATIPVSIVAADADSPDADVPMLDFAHHRSELTTLAGCCDTQEVSFYDDNATIPVPIAAADSRDAAVPILGTSRCCWDTRKFSFYDDDKATISVSIAAADVTSPDATVPILDTSRLTTKRSRLDSASVPNWMTCKMKGTGPTSTKKIRSIVSSAETSCTTTLLDPPLASSLLGTGWIPCIDHVPPWLLSFTMWIPCLEPVPPWMLHLHLLVT
jgi:hypothetical protein